MKRKKIFLNHWFLLLKNKNRKQKNLKIKEFVNLNKKK